MSFILGLDVGTASGAGATKRDGRVQPCALGDRSATIPAVVVLHNDGTTLIGDEAERIAGLELTRVARDVRLDPAQQTAPIRVGGSVHTPFELLRTLYSSMVERVCLSHSANPSHIVLTHPAVPEGMRCDMVDQIAEELFPGAMVVPEPIAAAVKLACDGTLPPECTLAVYDFGGGTFDITLVRREGDKFSVVGDPSGMPNFGGIDVDDLVLDHVNRDLDGAVARLDLGDPEAVAALTHLRAECRDAKERLSYETEVTIDASLPHIPALVRLTRSQFDEMLLPGLEATIDVLERTIADAGLHPNDVGAVALVGGSSRIPLVADLLGARTPIPVLVDPYPELTVALGAAQMVDDEVQPSSVFPFAELALPSLSALSAASAVGMVSPATGYPPIVAGQMSDPYATTVVEPRPEGYDETEFDHLMDRGRDMDATRHGGAGSTRSAAALNPKAAVAVLASVIVLLLAGLLVLGRSGGKSEAAEEKTGSNNTTSSSSSSSTTSSATTTPGSAGGTTPPSDTSTSSTAPRTTTTTGRPGTTQPPPTDPPGTVPPTNPPTTPTTRPPTTTTTTSTTVPPTTSSTVPPTSSTTTPPSTTSSSSSTQPPTPTLQPTFRGDRPT